MPGRHPCERGRRCSCHSAGPSTQPRRKKTTILAAVALVPAVLGAPTPTDLPFLYPRLERRAKDAGQAPDDPSEGFTHQHIQLADLIRAGLPYKYVYDANEVPNAQLEEIEVEMSEGTGAWVIDNAWSLHGRRFGPLHATATAGITDDPLPTPTESTTTTTPTILAIQSSLPTGWDSSQYARSDMYAIPLVVSFALVIALMIGSLIGAMVIRRDRSRSRRRKKRILQADDDSAREKVAQSSLVSRVGRALKHRDEPEPDPQEEAARDELEQRVKTWARRSAAWRAQARLGVRRRMGRGRKRSQADDGPAMGGAIQEEPEPEEEEARNSTRASSPAAPSRAPTPPAITIDPPPPSPAPNYASPTVPNYTSPPVAGPSTPSPLTRIEAHPDATPSDEPAYDGPGSGQGLPPAYRGGGLSQVARGKRPALASSESIHEPDQERQEERVWTELDAYAFNHPSESQGVTAHVATDDKQVLERLHLMRGAPEEVETGQVHAPREEDVFSGHSTPSGSVPSWSPATSTQPSSTGNADLPLPCASGNGELPMPSVKTGTGPVARYGEADMSLPRYLDGEGEGMGGAGLVPSEPGGEVPGVGLGVVPSAPPGEEIGEVPSGPSAPPLEASVSVDEASAPSLEEASAPPMDAPINEVSVASAPPLDDHPHLSVPSAPPLDDPTPLQDDTHPDDKPLHPAVRPPSPSAPELHRMTSSAPLLTNEQ